MRSARILVAASAGAAVLLIAAAAVTGRGLVRVPRGSFAAAGNRVLPPGWHAVSPLDAPRILSAEGDGAVPPVEITSREGVRATVRLSFRYRIDPATLARAASERGLGFHALLEESAGAGLREALGPRSASGWLDRSGLDPAVSASVTAQLGRIGVGASSIRWEVRLPEEFRAGLLRSEYAAKTRATGVRILLVGLDGADWESIDPLLREGRLPHLAHLLSGGIRGTLLSYTPMISPLLWTTLATGKGPDEHGIADFSLVSRKTGKLVPIGSRYRKVKTIWNILTDLDRRSAAVGWWASYPADRIEGILVSDRVAALSLLARRGELAGQPGFTFPPGYATEIVPRLTRPEEIAYGEIRRLAEVDRADFEAGQAWIARPPEPSSDPKRKPPVQHPVGLLIKILAATRNYHAIARDILGRGPFDLVGVYYEGIDLVGHRFQHLRPPEMEIAPPQERRRFSGTVSAFYAEQDRMLGELLAAAGPGVTVLIVSDHGFKTGARRPEGVLPYTMDQPVEWHRREGVFLLSGPAAARGDLREPATLFDVAPTILALLGIPIPNDFPGRVLTEAFDPVFHAKFPPARVPTYEGVGSEPTTEPAAETEEVSEEMMAQLRALGYVGDVHATPVREEESAAAPKPAPADPGEGPGAAGLAPGERVPGEPDPASGDEETDTPVTFHRNLASYLLSRREYEKAARELREANRREKLPKTYAMLAECSAALGRTGESLEALEEGWRATPAGMDPESVLWYADLAVGVGDSARARRFLLERREALEAAPAVRDAVEARLAEAAGLREEARRLYERALAADPLLVAATRQLLAIYRFEGRPEAIRPILEAGLAKSERVDEYHNLLGGLEADAGRKEEALARFRRAAEINPGDPRFPLNAGLTLMDLGRWEEAGRHFERAAASLPDAGLFLGLGNVRLRLGDPAGALEAFRRSRDLGGDRPRADLGIALSYLGLERPEEALAHAREGLARSPGDPALRNLVQDLSRRTPPAGAPR
jgi:tetratricopeptide (TPR) repeat protein